jgi:glycosyltransferase 2 family protein
MEPGEKTTDGPPLPKSIIKWAAVGLVLSSVVVIIISIFSGVTLSDLAKLGYLTFGLAAAVSASRLLVQVLRFRVIALGLAGDAKLDLGGLALARVASEFISLSTPATSMGVFLRTAWLSGKGVDGGKALWIGYFEVLIEIYVGAGLALIAAGYALLKGALVLGSTIALIATILIVGYTVVFVIPALKFIKVPHRVFSVAAYLVGGPRATALYLRAVVGSLNFSIAARAIVSRQTLPVTVKAVVLTILEDLLAGTALWLVLNAAGLKIDPLFSTLAAYGVVAIAQVPVSIGGAGITELTMQTYLTSIYGFSSWAAVVLWRIATYQVMLAITGTVFVVYLRKATNRPSKAVKK